MNKAATIWITLFLLALNACSTVNVVGPGPPDFLMEKVEPLSPHNVDITSDIIERTIRAESEFESLRQRFNILIDWFAQPES